MHLQRVLRLILGCFLLSGCNEDSGDGTSLDLSSEPDISKSDEISTSIGSNIWVEVTDRETLEKGRFVLSEDDGEKICEIIKTYRKAKQNGDGHTYTQKVVYNIQFQTEAGDYIELFRLHEDGEFILFDDPETSGQLRAILVGALQRETLDPESTLGAALKLLTSQ